MPESEAAYNVESTDARRMAIADLLRGGEYTKGELAERFGVSSRTIYDDLVHLMTHPPRQPVIMVTERTCRFTLLVDDM